MCFRKVSLLVSLHKCSLPIEIGKTPTLISYSKHVQEKANGEYSFECTLMFP